MVCRDDSSRASDNPADNLSLPGEGGGNDDIALTHENNVNNNLNNNQNATAPNLNGGNETVSVQEIHAEAEGYTPLSDWVGGGGGGGGGGNGGGPMMMMMMTTTMNHQTGDDMTGTMFMAYPPLSLDDDGDDDDDDDDDDRNARGGNASGATASSAAAGSGGGGVGAGGGGVFFADMNAFSQFGATMGGGEDDDDEDENDDDQEDAHGQGVAMIAAETAGVENERERSEQDFRALADQALKALTDDYDMTLKGGVTDLDSLSGGTNPNSRTPFEVVDPSNTARRETTVQNIPPATDSEEIATAPAPGVEKDEEDERISLDDADFDPMRPMVVAAAAAASGKIPGKMPSSRSSRSSCNSSSSNNSNNNSNSNNKMSSSSSPLAPVKELPPIDTDAVRRAVQAIRLKDPKLESNLDRWQRENVDAIAPREHPLIPPTPLSAFRKRSPKAIAATANLSRSATIADALERMRCLHTPTTTTSTTTTTDTTAAPETSTSPKDRLIMHVLGADSVECRSDDTLRAMFGPLVRWIGASDQSPRHIDIVLVGPNVPVPLPSSSDGRQTKGRPTNTTTTTTTTATRTTDLMPTRQLLKKQSPLISARAVCVTAVYHEWLLSSRQTREDGSDGDGESAPPPPSPSPPDLMIAFNAGIWGYKEWRPTLRALCSLPWPANLIVTSYTREEAEDDAQVIIEDVLLWHHQKEAGNAATDGHANVGDSDENSDDKDAATTEATKTTTRNAMVQRSVLWPVEPNPFGSRQKRDTATAAEGREYRENASWQAWRFGGGGASR